MYIATDRSLARILLLLLLYTFSGSCYNTSEGLIFLETRLIVKLNFLLADVVRTLSTFTTPKKFKSIVKSKNVGVEFINMEHYER